MKFLADAHISRMLEDFVRGRGHDCVHAEAVASGATDEELTQIAVRERRVILTSDKDFGALVFRAKLPAPGIVLLRIRAKSEAERLAILKSLWPAVEESVPGYLVVVSNHQVRRTRLDPEPL